MALVLVDRRGAGLDRRTPRSTQIASTIPSRRLGSAVAVPASTARAAASASIGSLLPRRRRVVRLGGRPPAPHAALQQEPGQPGAVGPSAFDADCAELSVATQPPQQLAVAVAVGGELGVGQQPAVLVDDGGVVGTAVGVDPADDNPRAVGHPLPALPLRDQGTRRPGGRTGQ
jgi:hypothetical protein